MIDYYFSFYRMYLKFEYEAKGLNEPVYFPGQLLPEYVAYEFPLHSVHMSLSYVFFLNLIFLSSVYVSSPLEASQYDAYMRGKQSSNRLYLRLIFSNNERLAFLIREDRHQLIYVYHWGFE